MAQREVDIIQKAMKAGGLNPRRFKDYVLISGDMMLDVDGTYRIPRMEDGPDYLLHKRRLHSILPTAVADRFWNKKLGIRRRRVPATAEQRQQARSDRR